MQPSRSNPLYSPLGCGAALLLILSLLLVLRFRGGGPFSPGPVTANAPLGEPLSGFESHAQFEENCRLCHVPWLGIEAGQCESCHTIVGQQRMAGEGLHGRMTDTGRCQRCHTEHIGREANITLIDLTLFEHDRLTEFSLVQHTLRFDGSPVACDDCHLQARYTGSRVECIDCHEAADPLFVSDHSDLFGTDCVSCHDGLDSMAQFDHQQLFPLNGAHATLDCDLCHTNQTFAQTPSDCIGCHREPAVHFGQFGTDCVRCHSVLAWAPAQLTQHTFPLDHGNQVNTECGTCHIDTYTVYSCYGCHEHNAAEIRQDHIDEGIAEFDACIDCHPTGLEDEAEERQET